MKFWQAVMTCCSIDGPTKKQFCSFVSRPVGGRPNSGLPSGSPGASRFVAGVSIDVGSCPPMYGEAQIGGKINGGGLGCGAQPTRFSPPSSTLPNWFTWAGPSVLLPMLAGAIFFLPSCAHSVPPPDWQPNGDGPLLKAPSSEWPIIMSPTADRIGARMSRLLSELSRVSVNTPDEPPLIVHVPGMSAGRSVEPC